MQMFKNSPKDNHLLIAFVENMSDNQEEDKISIYKIVDNQIEMVTEILTRKVYAICVSASIQNSGYEISKEFYQDNSYYIDINESNLNSNPLMNLGD